MTDVSRLSPKELLALHGSVAEELRARGITRTSNNPTGDFAEFLFCRAFGWTQAENSHANIDAIGLDGVRYQIKGRRTTRDNKSRQLGSIRDFKGRHFDFLAGVIFTEAFEVLKAAIIPYAVVEQRATFIAHTNSHKFILYDDVWDARGVKDVSTALRAVDF